MRKFIVRVRDRGDEVVLADGWSGGDELSFWRTVSIPDSHGRGKQTIAQFRIWDSWTLLDEGAP